MKNLNWLLVVFGILGLIGVRMVEDQWFYDPFINYFHEANRNVEFPVVVWPKLIVSHLFRFLLNLIFSAIVVQFIFLNKQWTLQAIILMVLVFAITFPIYLYCIYTHFDVGMLFSFYIRRFVIQPLILLLIIPMFYYRKQIQKKG